ncbi:polyketide cyclase [Afipia sp. P52-10]|uniref:nuclear transport factor 2 family protein n=1 Tax=Afipia sp. P52-10 TaxID=1429916 RepID=UPI0003DF0AC8|nr:nuclear transport factor 2 family protein [Afipia sp. P52-10]ETR77936.1 polyketide cyclase [Afipia sp. P52-10]
MPSRETIEAFSRMVESGDHVGAIERFYAADASTRENMAEPVRGRDALMTKERKVLSSYRSVATYRLGPILIDGDKAAFHWRFEFTPENGPTRVLEEVALQTWRGEELVEEHFFYDPRQMTQA